MSHRSAHTRSTFPVRRIGICAASLAGALLLLELALQGLSWIQHVTLAQQYTEQLPAQIDVPAERRVLCVGDSFTCGIGASSKDTSYPARLVAAHLLGDEPSWPA